MKAVEWNLKGRSTQITAKLYGFHLTFSAIQADWRVGSAMLDRFGMMIPRSQLEQDRDTTRPSDFFETMAGSRDDRGLGGSHLEQLC